MTNVNDPSSRTLLQAPIRGGLRVLGHQRVHVNQRWGFSEAEINGKHRVRLFERQRTPIVSDQQLGWLLSDQAAAFRTGVGWR